MKTLKLRYGNIECRSVSSMCTYDYEVVKWSPNPLYGKKDEYKKEFGLGDITYEKDGVTYSESCFAHPETCYVVSFIRWNNREPCWEVTEVGTRPFELDKEDFDDWARLMKTVINILPEPSYEND